MALPRGPAGARFPVSSGRVRPPGAAAAARKYKADEAYRANPLAGLGVMPGGRGRSKKGYTGSVAGLGRAKRPTPATGPIYRRGPAGPGGARFSAVNLPQRSTTRATPPPKANKRPGLINRIFRRMRGA